MNRRAFVGSALTAAQSRMSEITSQLKPMTSGVTPISVQREQRIEKARRLMTANKIDAIIVEPGSSMMYFTGIALGPQRADLRGGRKFQSRTRWHKRRPPLGPF